MFDLEKILKDTLKEEKSKKKAQLPEKELHSFLPGEYLDENQLVYLAEFQYPLPFPHGDNELKKFSLPHLIYSWAKINYDAPLQELIFYDTETTGLSGGTGTWAFLTGTGWFSDTHFHLRQYFMTDPAGEEPYLQAIAKDFAQHPIPVSFNGRSYDANLLNSRCIMNALPPFLAEVADIDILYLARRLWKKELSKCSLNHLEENLLGLVRPDDQDLPSADIPDLYYDFLDTGNAALLDKVFAHNRTDILSMPVLLNLICDIIDDKSNLSYDHASLGRLYNSLGFPQLAESVFQKGLQGSYASYCRKDLSFFYKRNGNLIKAVELWKLDADTQLYALIELAKFYEHKQKNLSLALQYTQKALDMTFNADFIPGKTAMELHKRQNRLQNKIDRDKN